MVIGVAGLVGLDVGCQWRIYIASMPSEGEESILLPHEGENKNTSVTKIPSFLAYSLTRKRRYQTDTKTHRQKHTRAHRHRFRYIATPLDHLESG